MKLFSNLLKKIKEKSAVAEKDREIIYYQLLDFIASSEEVKTNLKIELKQAFETPRVFYDKYNRFILSDRGLIFPEDAALTPLFVLVDALIANGEMAEIDWQEDENEIRNCIQEITFAKRLPLSIISQEIHTDKNTQKIILSINEEEIIPNEHTLLFLNINSDSYVFTIVPIEISKMINQLFLLLKQDLYA